MNLPFITIVSGLPRSGTSMMMQAIEAGGIPALTDNIRKKDVKIIQKGTMNSSR